MSRDPTPLAKDITLREHVALAFAAAIIGGRRSSIDRMNMDDALDHAFQIADQFLAKSEGRT